MAGSSKEAPAQLGTKQLRGRGSLQPARRAGKAVTCVRACRTCGCSEGCGRERLRRLTRSALRQEASPLPRRACQPRLPTPAAPAEGRGWDGVARNVRNAVQNRTGRQGRFAGKAGGQTKWALRGCSLTASCAASRAAAAAAQAAKLPCLGSEAAPLAAPMAAPAAAPATSAPPAAAAAATPALPCCSVPAAAAVAP